MAKNKNKNSSSNKQPLRQRKKHQQQQQQEDDDEREETSTRTKKNGSSSNEKVHKQNSGGLFIAGGLILVVLLVIMAVIPPNSSDDTSRTTKKPKSKPKDKPAKQQRKLETQQKAAPDRASSRSTTSSSSPSQQQRYSQIIKDYKILQVLPHDTTSFTQGLTFHPANNSIVYESTGMYNESVVRILDLAEEGKVLQQFDTPGKYFGEGLSYFPTTSDKEGRLIHITWKEQTGFIMNTTSLEILEEFQYTTTTNEGWGIIHVPGQDLGNSSDDVFVVSDGSAYLHYWKTTSPYNEIRPKIEVTYRTQEMAATGKPPSSARWLNELEYDYATHTILANVWYQNIILRIDPTTGFVTHIYDLSTLYTNRQPKSDVFNGIALAANGDLWVTGKYWPHLYRIELSGGDSEEKAG